jgi:murein DD-endopeptidase MepM/ murein hydrolase activator NlpD
MARRIDAPRRRPAVVVVAALVALLGVSFVGAMLVLGGQKGEQLPTAAASSGPGSIAAADASPAHTATSAAATSRAPASRVPPSPPPVAASTPAATATPGSTQSPPADAAPSSAVVFDLQSQEIDIDFPLRADTVYHYRDNWYERRLGPPDSYNHAKLGADGELVRLHDGIDIYAPEGEPVLAPFDGVVIDPANRWAPWEPDRYGLTVVVQSDERDTSGYMAVLVHLDRVWVDIGQHVNRGQVIGVLGRTGNAEEVKPQLHFELRAPFPIDWSSMGEDRLVDAFNPYPSLVEADPKR